MDTKYYYRLYIKKDDRVNNNWDKQWYIWYFLRPLVSMIAGRVSWLFLKAGVLVLDAQQTADSNYYGYFALSFIAGYNVDNFLRKIEEVVKSIRGIEKTRGNREEKVEKEIIHQ